MTPAALRAVRVLTPAVAVAGLLSVASADATRIVKIASRVSIRGEGLRFVGRVTSSNHACVPMREVTLYRTNGNVLGHTHTNAHGNWKITVSGSAGISLGRFYAKVRRTSQGTAGTIYVCKGARSPTIRYHS